MISLKETIRKVQRTVDGDVDDIGTGGSSSNHTGDGDTGGIVRMDVDGEIGVLLSDSPDKPVVEEGATEHLPDR